MAYYIDRNTCQACHHCLEICMNGAMVALIDQPAINPARCQECGSCEAICFHHAIHLEGFVAHENEFLNYANWELDRVENGLLT